MRELPVLGCTLDPAEMTAQRDRYTRLATHVARVVRAPQRLTVRFDAAVDHTLLADTLAVEADCCSFFAIALEGDAAELTVPTPDLDPALDAIAHALGAGDRT